jgi:flagellin-like hook-associated protein FlgL
MVGALTRSGDASLYKSALTDMAQTSNKIETAQKHITSGKNMSSFADAGEYCGRILGLELEISGLEDYEQGETTVMNRLLTMENIIRDLNSMAMDYRARLNKVVSYGDSDGSFQNYCAKQLAQVERLLNTQDPEGRYLFGGEVTSTPPVDVSKVVAPSIGAPATYSYYLGTITTPPAIMSDGQVVAYGITARDDGFAQLISALAMGVVTSPSNDASTQQYQTLINGAIPLIDQASRNIPDSLQELGTSMKLIEQSADRQDTVKVYSKDLFAKITEANLVESLVRVNKEEMILKISIAATQKSSESMDELLDALKRMR